MFELDKATFSLVTKERVSSILKCNEVLQKHGLILSEKNAYELLKTQQDTVKDVGRIEFKNTIIEDIVTIFSDSIFFTKYDFADQIQEIIEIFYYYREVTEGIVSDEDLIKYLYLSFEGPCQGSLSWLGDNQLNVLLDSLNNGYDIFEAVEYGTY
jgi:hypothetical protein